MTMGDKISYAAQKAAGKLEETTGKATGDKNMESDGRADQVSANMKQAGDKIGDAVKDATDD